MGWDGVKRHFQVKIVPQWPTKQKSVKHESLKTNGKDQRFFSQQGDSSSTLEKELTDLFESLRDAAKDEKDKMELESTMEYLQSHLKINLENAELFVAIYLVQAPSIGEITLRGFVDGWKLTAVPASLADQAAHVRQLVAKLSKDKELFRKVYKYAFIGGREKDQKALDLENATVFWGTLFSSPGMRWETKNHNWLELWKSFLEEKWTRSVNKDMWNMTLEFAFKSMEDESLSFWNEDGAWPSVIDDFVGWCHGKGIGKTEQMDVDGEQ
ncbi:hypothetical protein VHEMI07514 [[Torrubiella] hemipterigena]|uniref:Defective in cullin neddylation protein n=1 Tax=[Torrubiella] hemipterigena TaxID=1531966 RepID=A0A0A1TN27_9HYPO|nr:hypothetical protein VHEMI07514 [[Torrubiella] hemipterigena]